MPHEALLPSIVFVPFLAAALSLGLGRVLGKRCGVLMVFIAAASFLQCVQIAVSSPGTSLVFVRDWIPSLHVFVSFRADPFGIFFASLISGIGTLVGIYSLSYIPELAPARVGRYYASLLAFMGAMLGVALADDLILLFIFWEITSVASFLLIGFWYEEDKARKGANTALLVTALGGLSMMAGFLILGITTDSFSLRALTEQPALRERLAVSPLLVPALLLVVIGAMTKSAQWPFHFWLPGAMVAPTPVSTYLHAATMVKAGVFLLGRFMPIFGDSAAWAASLVPLGLVTFLLGAVQAFLDSDLKAILAKTTIATLGLITMLYGIGAGDQDALQILSHATYKGALFLVAGIVEHVAHTRDIRQLGGLRRRLPISFAVSVVAALALGGVWPSLGFFSKEALYSQLLSGTLVTGWVPGRLILTVSVLANAFLLAVACRIVFGVFFGEAKSDAHGIHEGPPALWIPAAVLSLLAIALGLVAPITARLVSHFSSLPGTELHFTLLPTHLDATVLSILTFALGVAIYIAGAKLNAVRGRIGALPEMQAAWDGFIDAVTRAAVGFSVRWQNGSLRWYLTGSLVFAVGLSALAVKRAGVSLLQVPINLQEMSWYGVTLCAMLCFTGIMVARSQTRLGAAIALTSNGFFTALLFVLYRSPDILLTQILIETVSTIFLLLVFYFMPVFRPDRLPPLRRLINVAVSVAVGFSMFSLTILCMSPQFREVNNLAADYLTRSLAQAGGANAVNVIIVDFRAIDTNGEITVLVLVGLLVYGLLRARRKPA